MSKNITLDKIDSKEKYYEIMRSTRDKIEGSEAELAIDNEIIERKEKCDFYIHEAASPLGDFAIYQGTQYVGDIGLGPIRSSNFESDGIVNIIISYSLAPQYRGQGIMVEAIKIAIEYIRSIKESNQDIPFVECMDQEQPKEHMLFIAKAIGTVKADVLIQNYPSLSCSIKAGGKVNDIYSMGVIVTFLDQSNNFSDAFTLQLLECSRELCKIGFNEHSVSDDTPTSRKSSEQQSGALKALEILPNETEDTNAKGIIAGWFIHYAQVQAQKSMVQDNSAIAMQNSEANTCVVADQDLLDVHLGGANNPTDCE